VSPSRHADLPLDQAAVGALWCYPLKKRTREKLHDRLRGLEYRQQAREQQRSERQKAYRIAAMMREQGTLRGARKYFELKAIPYHESVDAVTGCHELTVPRQITLSYDADGRFLSSRPPGLSAAR
jgi:hypothetical protein